MRNGSLLLGRALALGFILSCWLPACGGSTEELFSEGAGGAAAGAAGSKAGSGGSSVAGSSQGGAGQAGTGQGGTGQGGTGQGGTGQGGTGQGGTGQGGTGQGGSSGNCPFTDNIDHDGDGWSFTDGDCNDCDALVNPGAFDGKGQVGYPGLDDDCDGTPDNAVTECDTGLALDDADPFSAARALGLCALTTEPAAGKEKRWGVISARYTDVAGNGVVNPLQRGLMPAFGAKAVAQQGASMLVLSSGTARAPGQPGYASPGEGNLNVQGVAPPGFPKASTLCPGVVPKNSLYDPAALEVLIRVPTNAKGFGYMLNLYTYEYPDYVCSEFNDLFVTLVSPNPAGSTDGNITFDQYGNTIGASCGLLQVCVAKTVGSVTFTCPLGTGLLAGTGFETGGTSSQPHGATGWLQTISPATPGSLMKIRFAVADVGDAIFSTTVLLDRFEWVPPIAAPSTQPVANPL